MSDKDILDLGDALKDAIEDSRKKQEELRQASKPKFRFPYARYLAALLVLIAPVYAWIQMPKIIAVFAPTKVMRLGPYYTDRLTDRCIANLWEEAGGVQGGKCPVADQPYVRTGEDICCPHPERHGFKRLCFEGKKRLVRVE